jgi:uncharacterized glyoxalase superfamily protein PhnB
MSFKLTALTPMLETYNMQATIDFYTETVGFKIENYTRDSGRVSLMRDGINLMFTTPNQHRNISEAAMSGSLYLNTDNIDEVWKNLKDKCNICYPIEDFDYGMREFAVYDNNGYLLQFGQEL